MKYPIICQDGHSYKKVQESKSRCRTFSVEKCTKCGSTRNIFVMIVL